MDEGHRDQQYNYPYSNLSSDLDDLFPDGNVDGPLDWRDFSAIPSPVMSRAISEVARHETSLGPRIVPIPHHDYHLVESIWSQMAALGQRIEQLEGQIERMTNSVTFLAGHDRERSVSRALLDRECEKLFRDSPVPSRTQLNSLLEFFDTHCPFHDRITTRSTIRKWFRKRRERVTNRLLVVFKQRYAAPLSMKAERENLIGRVEGNEDNIVTDLLEREKSLLRYSEAGLHFAIERLVHHLCDGKI